MILLFLEYKKNKLMNTSTYIPRKTKFDPDSLGHFGKYGGRYTAETLMPALIELEEAYFKIRQEKSFWEEVQVYFNDFIGRPSPLYYATNISSELNAKIYLKREDLNHTGAHKINSVVVQALLAKRMGKKRIIAETGAGQHGVATATVCALLNLECDIFMGAKDIKRQESNVFKMKLLGANVISVTSGSETLKDALNDALRDWVSSSEWTYFLIGTAAGTHPYPLMVRDIQAIIGYEARKQFLEKEGKLPDFVIACLGGGSNAIGMFHYFLEDENVQCIGIEAGGLGIDTNKHGASLTKGRAGVIHGFLSYLLQDDDGQVLEASSISAGLDYPGIGPEHAYLKDEGIVQYEAITDAQALKAFSWVSKKEGIIPALESSHALAYLKEMKNIKDKNIIVNLSGRGDKDMDTIMKNLNE